MIAVIGKERLQRKNGDATIENFEYIDKNIDMAFSNPESIIVVG
jgi:hypothetical protein